MDFIQEYVIWDHLYYSVIQPRPQSTTGLSISSVIVAVPHISSVLVQSLEAKHSATSAPPKLHSTKSLISVEIQDKFGFFPLWQLHLEDSEG